MRRLRMLEEQELGSERVADRIEIIAEMHAYRLHAGFGSEPLCTGLYNLRWPHNVEEYTLKMNVEIERLKLEILLLEPPPQPHCDLSPRRSPTIGTGLDKPEMPHSVTQQTAQKGTSPFQAYYVDGFLHVDCTRILDPEGTVLLEADVGVKPQTTKYKLPLARRLRNRRRTGSSEG